MIYTHKGYQGLLSTRTTNQGTEWVARAKKYSVSIEQKVFAQWCGTDLITSLDIEQTKQHFVEIVELFLQEHEDIFPMYPRPELPDATIEAILDERVYLTVNNSGRHHTAKFRVFAEERLRVFPARIPIPVGIKPNVKARYRQLVA
ncbi:MULTISPECIES: hypothetical protein [Pseudanabaena]|jgi:hypothetical protein|uniref:hypothetical protein n=1 Tax=Pseudanabaena TaxID=1152 RepID=UPI002479181A|nr:MULTISPECIES: hypothetical protein [Pseudanabaena]MEA5486778.1 hypothetical protein [Pseudanabaena sp. CCNP1317]WGS74783.1 hypothetical protein OA858_22565 [Pseudanabaena galeata CCNP1313]